MLEKVKEFLYDEENGLMTRFRDGLEKLNDQEKEILLEFSNEVNKHVTDGKVSTEEFMICMDIVYTLMTIPALQSFANRFYYNISKGNHV